MNMERVEATAITLFREAGEGNGILKQPNTSTPAIDRLAYQWLVTKGYAAMQADHQVAITLHGVEWFQKGRKS